MASLIPQVVPRNSNGDLPMAIPLADSSALTFYTRSSHWSAQYTFLRCWKRKAPVKPVRIPFVVEQNNIAKHLTATEVLDN